MSDLNPNASDAAYWRSLEEHADSPAFRRFLEAEFPQRPEDYQDGPSRRQFLKLMGASLAMAGVAGCRWPRQTIVPAQRMPKDRLPGQPVQYATAVEIAGVGLGLLATSYDGRPIKIDGNDKHPITRGKSSAQLQATVLELYDPDRSKWPIERDRDGQHNRTWEEFDNFARTHFANVRDAGGAKVAILARASHSPTLRDLRRRMATQLPQATWYAHDALAPENELAGAALLYGRHVRPLLHLDRARVIATFDSDLLLAHPDALKHARDFAPQREARDGTMNRLYAFESDVSLTGSVADQRHPVRSSQIHTLLLHLAAALRERLVGTPIGNVPPPTGALPIPPDLFAALVDDLAGHAGQAVLSVGPQHPPATHALVHLLNAWLGAPGETISYVETPAPDPGIAALCDRINAGQVKTLLILDGNPVQTAPRVLNGPGPVHFADALAKVPTSIHLSLHDNETSQHCGWHLPLAHYLESWGDVRAVDGTVSITQPLIEPLYRGRTAIELIAALLGDEHTAGYDLTRRTFRKQFLPNGYDFENTWNKALHDGVVEFTSASAQVPALRTVTIPADKAAPDDFELVFRPDYSVADGRYANNAWLQEWPDPITKLTWDNAALIAPQDAAALGIQKKGDMLRIEVAGQALELPAYILAGHAPGSITIPIGYGRGAAAGAVADGAGFDVEPLRSTGRDIVTGARVTGTGKTYELVGTQDHHAIDSTVGRESEQQRIDWLVREDTLAHYKEHPDFAKHRVHRRSSSRSGPSRVRRPQVGHGDRPDACIGCSACVLACQAENNIPVVGKARSRWAARCTGSASTATSAVSPSRPTYRSCTSR
jgi:MoCo/4Fe-4S cofactor protein with predicted Tat translocation signal